MSLRKTVLIIDDEVDLCMLMRAYFLRKNYDVYIAHQIDDALSRIKDCHPNFILLASATCQKLEEDIKRIKEAAPSADIIINGVNRLDDD